MKINIAIAVSNTLVNEIEGRPLNDIEILILRGAWERLDYDQIAAQNQYATSYISQDVAPKLWKLLSRCLGSKVKKSNIKSLLEAYSQEHPDIHQEKSKISPAAHRSAQPLPNASLHQATAQSTTQSVSASSQASETGPFYVERPPLENICFKTLIKPGALLRIKAPRFMGKTALMTQVMTELTHQNYQLGRLSFEWADSHIHFSDPSKLLKWFCLTLGQSLGIANKLNDYWDEDFFGAKMSCTNYLEQYLLPQIQKPIVIALDDIDLLFPHSDVSTDFFGLLRAWYEKAKYQPQWQQLRFMIAHSTDVYVRLKLNQSPFNVGVAVELPEFTAEQAMLFATNYGLKNSQTLIDAMMALVGGHPYLLLRAFNHFSLNEHETLSQVLQYAATEAGIFGDHLREMRLDLATEARVEDAFRKIISSSDAMEVDPTIAYRLQNMGLVNQVGHLLTPRCKLYQLYFESQMP